MTRSGRQLLQRYRNSLALMLQTFYPEHTWRPWRFLKAPNGLWDNLVTQRAFFEELAEKMNVQTQDDWYRITQQHICDLGGSALLVLYNGSVLQMLRVLYPEFSWQPWRFNHVPQGYWEERKHQRQALDQLATELNVGHWENWYTMTSQHITTHGGGGLLTCYGRSPAQMVQTLYPEYPWLSWRFCRVPDGFWNEKTKHREVLEQLAMQLSIVGWEDWYQVPQQHIQQHVGQTLMREYGYSVPQMLQTLFPEYPWISGKFGSRLRALTLEQSGT